MNAFNKYNNTNDYDNITEYDNITFTNCTSNETNIDIIIPQHYY